MIKKKITQGSQFTTYPFFIINQNLGICIYNYLQAKSVRENEIDVIFYSDNCAGQQKNNFMLAVYSYRLKNRSNIKSITHKYLIKGHIQNEGDSAHSLIEKQVETIKKWTYVHTR